MVLEYLVKNYDQAEPIFFGDIPLNGKSKPELSMELRVLVEKGYLHKIERGVYYLPKMTRMNIEVEPSPDMVARYKYISRRGQINGYYAGNSLANRFGISTQVPRKPEMVSNHMSAKYKEVSIGKMTFIIRRPVVRITNENVYVLQLLELLKSLDVYMDGEYEDAREPVIKYIKKYQITKDDVDSFIRFYPLSVFKNYYEMRLEDVLAS